MPEIENPIIEKLKKNFFHIKSLRKSGGFVLKGMNMML